jgi:hypothetical protein
MCNELPKHGIELSIYRIYHIRRISIWSELDLPISWKDGGKRPCPDCWHSSCEIEKTATIWFKFDGHAIRGEIAWSLYFI